MKSLFNLSDSSEIIDRINRLTPQSKSSWGKMNVEQMLAHSQRPLNVASGNLKLKRGLIGVLFGGIAKRKLAGEDSFKKNLPTAPEFVVKDPKNFEEEKKKLIELVQQFAKAGPAGLSKDPHPFFGNLRTEEWDILNWKHLDHHLRQFGV